MFNDYVESENLTLEEVRQDTWGQLTRRRQDEGMHSVVQIWI